MEVTVRLFAMLRERAGAGEVSLELPEGASVADALHELSDLAEGLPLVMAVNREYAGEEHVLEAGDELALIPPVSGGSTQAAPWVRVCEEPLSLEALAARVRDPRAGAVVTFQGVTREVELLRYEAYVEMAEERLAAIAARGRRAPRPVRRGRRAPGRRGPAVGAERGRGRLGAAPRRGLRGRARDHRPGEGRGPDLEAGGRGRRGALGRGAPTR